MTSDHTGFYRGWLVGTPNAVHAAKRGMGRREDLTTEELEELAKEVKQGLWKGTE